MGYKVAVVGATGNVGREILQILAEREFPVDEVVALASERSAGREISFGEDDVLQVQDLATFDFSGTDIVLSSPGAKISAQFRCFSTSSQWDPLSLSSLRPWRSAFSSPEEHRALS